MAKIKLFGGRRHSPKLTGRRRVLLIVLAVLAVLEGGYLLFTFSSIPFLQSLRKTFIETAMSTMRYQWLATDLFPASVVDEVMAEVSAAQEQQVSLHSTWDKLILTNADEPELSDAASAEEKAFFALFRELDPTTMRLYLQMHPEALEHGWAGISIDEADLDSDGTTILTNSGDPVLAIDAPSQTLLIRVADIGYRGVLAIAKDPTKLSIEAASHIGEFGAYAGEIASAHDGILAMTANGFIDVDDQGNLGMGNGGIVCGYTMCNGVSYGQKMGRGYKRMELRKDDLLYIVDSGDPVHPDCTDAAEFTPALLVDGQVVVNEYSGWNAVNPRAIIGQNRHREIMMLCVEGRQLTSIGITLVSCAEILDRYDCCQALNLDGGTSAILWYNGRPVTRCSNPACPEGRPLPNAFVYRREP